MQAKFLLTIDNPDSHFLQVRLKLEDLKSKNILLFIASWSPGSYLMREYSRNIRKLKISSPTGKDLNWLQVKKGSWSVDTENLSEIIVDYEVYCHDLTVRTSHITNRHAFLHGPTFYMGAREEDDSKDRTQSSNVDYKKIEIQVKFPALWSKISTGLETISKNREEFIYRAENFDQLMDCPIEIGCQYTNGFMIQGIPHEIAIFGAPEVDLQLLVSDMKKIIETVLKCTKEIPYTRYLFIIHFAPQIYGGLEHSNSTVLHFSSFDIAQKERYDDWLTLVAHEYFHTWNVKRIRPIELGPFNYTEENYTRMHWLTEGLTSCMDELLTLRSGLINLDDYLRMQKRNLVNFFKNQGKYFDSLEDSSFNAWIKLYRQDENSTNSSISYYLKGGIAFWILNSFFVEHGKDINDLIDLLWKRYKENPAKGIVKTELYSMIVQILGNELGNKIKEEFSLMVETTQDLPILRAFKIMGMKLVFSKAKIDMGWEINQTTIKSVHINGVACRDGLYSGDEIIAINGNRVTSTICKNISSYLKENQKYEFTISRNNLLVNIHIIANKGQELLEKIEYSDSKKSLILLGVEAVS